MISFRKHVGRILLLMLLLICFSQSIFYSSKSKNLKKIQLLSTDENILDGYAAITMQKTEEKINDPIHFTVWGEVKNGTVKSDWNRSAEVNALLVKGDTTLVYENAQNLSSRDVEGCLLSENIVYQLYGDNNVTGKIIEYNGRNLIIREVIKDTNDLIIMQALSSTEQIMNYVSIEIRSDEEADDVVREFNNRYSGYDNFINIQSYGTWASVISGILPIIMLLTILIPLIKFVLANRRQPEQFILYSVLAIVYTGVFLWITNFEFQYPTDMIPSKWSDFSFWSSLYKEKIDDIEILLRTEKNMVQMVIIEPFLQTIKYSLFAIILYITAVRRFKFDRIKDVLLYGIVCLVHSFYIICSQTFQDSEIDLYRPIWLLMIIFLLGSYSKYKLVHKFKPVIDKCKNAPSD